jgi:hypothetical protein
LKGFRAQQTLGRPDLQILTERPRAMTHQRAMLWALAPVRPKRLRDRKKRCSQTLQRKGTMPIDVRKISNSRRCDLRMLDSRHFGHVIAMASKLP